MRLSKRLSIIFIAAASLAGCGDKQDTRANMTSLEKSVMRTHVTYDYTGCDTCGPFFENYPNLANSVRYRVGDLQIEPIAGLANHNTRLRVKPPYCDSLDAIQMDERLIGLNGNNVPRSHYITNLYKSATGSELSEDCDLYEAIQTVAKQKVYPMQSTAVIKKATATAHKVATRVVDTNKPVYEDPAIAIELYKKASAAATDCRRAADTLMDATSGGRSLTQQSYGVVMNAVLSCEKLKFENRINGG